MVLLLDLNTPLYPFSFIATGGTVTPEPPIITGGLVVSKDFNAPTAIYDQISRSPVQQGLSGNSVTLTASSTTNATPPSDEVTTAKETPEQYGIDAARATLTNEMSRPANF